ncbi:MAG: TetR/AcrR family transcriptional regulator [Treponema sp.]|jgi:AcrR family transcriptional regulator|nr:TetR/AcrR family transcriptional regulator [Treponema sp.]
MTQTKENTKEKILNQAFALLSEATDYDIALAQIAKGVGISKAAIFRHFKDKAALLDAMKERCFDNLADALYVDFPEIGKPVKTSELIKTIVRFIAEKPEYFGVMKKMCAHARTMEVMITEEFGKRGIRALKTKQDAHSPEKIYAFTTVLYCVLQYRLNDGTARVAPSLFAERLTDFLMTGWQEIRELSGEEKERLSQACVLEPELIPEEDRFFSALIQVVLKYGFTGITVERIAGELGMAKSSLYAFFENKDKLVEDLVKKEVTYLIAALSEKLSGVTDLSSAVYVYLHVVTRYLIARPELTVVIVWYFARGGTAPELYREINPDDVSDGLRLLVSSNAPDVGCMAQSHRTAMWLASLPVSLMIHQLRHNGGGGSFFFNNADALIDRIHRQIGHPLPDDSECILEPRSYTI